MCLHSAAVSLTWSSSVYRLQHRPSISELYTNLGPCLDRDVDHRRTLMNVVKMIDTYTKFMRPLSVKDPFCSDQPPINCTIILSIILAPCWLIIDYA